MKKLVVLLAGLTASVLILQMPGESGGITPFELPGLLATVQVQRDASNVPHILAQNDHDATFMQGYVHAQDRFFQMDSLRRTFSGTLAEMLGPAALGSDVQFRTLGLRRAAEESYSSLPGPARDFVGAYAEGVNAFLNGGELPPEYQLLELTEVPAWTALDSVVVAKGFSFGLSFDLDDLERTLALTAFQEAGSAMGFDGTALFFEDLYRSAPFDPTVSIPGVAQGPAGPSAPSGFRSPVDFLKPGSRDLLKRFLEQVSRIPILKDASGNRRRLGSNWWVASGSMTESGYPMLANDPHLSLGNPAIFHELQLNVPGQLSLTGVGFPGVPGVVQGCNDTICWGSTVNPLDVTDVYQETLVALGGGLTPTHTLFEGVPEPLHFIPQTFLVNQIGDQENDNLTDAGVGPFEGGVTLIVPRRNNGPIVAVDASNPFQLTAFSVQYTGWSGTQEIEAFRRLRQAENFEEFTEGLQFFDVGSQNWAYADRLGNIAYYTSAEAPIREDLQKLGFPDGGVPPFLIRDGTHGLQHEWLPVENPQPHQAVGFEILPFSEMPQVVNPERGYILNANNDPVGLTLDNDPLNQLRPGGGVFYLNPGYATGLRMGRIQNLFDQALEGGKKLSFDQLRAFQSNNQMLDAEVLVPYLQEAFARIVVPAQGGSSQAAAALLGLASDPAISEAVSRLQAWDFSTPTGIAQGYDPGDDPLNLPSPGQAEIDASIAATIYSVWRGQLVRSMIDDTLRRFGLESGSPPSMLALSAVRNILDNFEVQQGFGASGIDFFFMEDVSPEGASREEVRDLFLLRSLRRALDLLAGEEFAAAFGNSTDQSDYRWGYLHRIVFRHLLGGPFNIPPAGGYSSLSPELPGLARSGGFGAVDASSHSIRADGVNEFMFGSGPAQRMVAHLTPFGPEILGSVPSYQEPRPGGESPQGIAVTDPLALWLTHQYRPRVLDPELVIPTSVDIFSPDRIDLFFPNYRGDESSFTGFAASNLSSGSLDLTFRSRDAAGSLQDFPQNPSLLQLEPGRQLALLGHEIFGASASTPQLGWVDMQVVPLAGFPLSGPPVGSFTLSGDGVNSLDGGVALTGQFAEFVFSRVHQGPAAFRGLEATTTLNIANPNTEEIDLMLTLVTPELSQPAHSPSGPSPLAATRTLPPGGSLSESIAQLFPEAGPVDGGHVQVRVTRGRGAVGTETIRVNDSTLIELHPLTDNDTFRFFSAQLASGPGIFTNLKLINVSGFTRMAQATILTNEGEPAAEPILFPLEPGQTFVADAATLLGNSPAGAAGEETREGSLLVETNGRGVVGDVVFGDAVGGGYAAGLSLQYRTFRRAIFSHVANTPDFFTGIALYFPESSGEAEITIEVFDSDGNLNGEATLVLDAGNRVTGLLADLVPGVGLQAGGFIRVTSNRAIAGQILFGTFRLSLLAALPPTIVE